jgi:phosphoglycolate phosphatase-like HAD superfamily hydrolase
MSEIFKYADIDTKKKAFVFELDDVLFPEKDYILQVYYLFSNFIEFTEGFPPAVDMTEFMKNAYSHHGDDGIFDRVKEAFGIDEKYRENLERLYYTAVLPLKLLLFDDVLKFLQDIVIDRKLIFILTNGKPEVQINKIRQTEWNGLEQYLKVYYAGELNLKPEPDALSYIMKEYNLHRDEVLIVGANETDSEFAVSCGVDFLHVSEIM